MMRVFVHRRVNELVIGLKILIVQQNLMRIRLIKPIHPPTLFARLRHRKINFRRRNIEQYFLNPCIVHS